MFLIDSVVTVYCCLMVSVLKGGLICVIVMVFAISARSINLVCNFSLTGNKIPLHITVTTEHLCRNDTKDLVDNDNLGSCYPLQCSWGFQGLPMGSVWDKWF